jgi:hypothetical protein
VCCDRARRRERYKQLAAEDRRGIVARRDPEKVRAADRARYERDKPKRRAAQADYRTTSEGKAAMEQGVAKWRAANPEKRKAHVAVGNAVRDGRLEKADTCELHGPDCLGRIEAHHDNYAKLLEVRWLCRRHHIQAHRLTVPVVG